MQCARTRTRGWFFPMHPPSPRDCLFCWLATTTGEKERRSAGQSISTAARATAKDARRSKNLHVDIFRRPQAQVREQSVGMLNKRPSVLVAQKKSLHGAQSTVGRIRMIGQRHLFVLSRRVYLWSYPRNTHDKRKQPPRTTSQAK